MKFLLLLLSINAFAMSHKHEAVSATTPIPSATPIASVTPTPTPWPAGTKIVTLKCDSSCTPAEAVEVPIIEDLMNRTVLSECFSNYFKNRGRIDLAQGYSGTSIVSILRKTSNLTLNYYIDNDDQVDGYESANDYTTIHFNRKSMINNHFGVCDKASLAEHELTHTKGFFHKGNRANPNYYTVPYTANHAFDTKDDFGEVQADYGGCCPEI